MLKICKICGMHCSDYCSWKDGNVKNIINQAKEIEKEREKMEEEPFVHEEMKQEARQYWREERARLRKLKGKTRYKWKQ